MKKVYTRILVTAFIISSTLFCAFAKSEPAPDWVLNWQSVYPDSEYIAQKGTGKKAEQAKNEALTNISFYFNSKISAVRESNYNSFQNTTDNGKKIKVKEVSSLETIRNTTVTSQTDLNGVEYTEPYYNKKDKTWHCVAFIARKTIWDKNEPALRSVRDAFKGFYDKANESSDCFEKICYLTMAREQGIDFIDKYSECQFFSEKLTSAAYGSDMQLLSSLNSLIQEQKNKCRFFVDVNKDSGKQVYSAVTQVLSENGFTVTKDRSSATHTAKCFVNFEKSLQDKIYIYSPSIEISIFDKKTTSYTYSKNCGRFKVFTEANGEKKSFEAISKALKESFEKDFNSALGVKNN